MELGTGIKPERVEKILAGSDFVDGETVQLLVKISSFRPLMDTLIVTSVRVLGWSAGESKARFAATLSHISGVVYDEAKRTIEIRTSDGSKMLFKGLAVEDVEVAQRVIDALRSGQVDEKLLEAAMDTPLITPVTRQEARESAREDRLVTRELNREDKATRKEAEAAQRKLARQNNATADLDTYGTISASAIFGGKTVTVYSKGYVQVGGMFIKNSRRERLLGIEASSDVTKKSALGRSLGAVASGGYSLLSSNKRGDVYLAIVTDTTTHVLHEDPPTASGLKASKMLEAAGQAVLALASAGPTPVAAAEGAPAPAVATEQFHAIAPANRLRELATMLEEGLISADEHDTLRQKVLDTL